MPDASPPSLGWGRTWRSTGRYRGRAGFLGIIVSEREEWRYPLGDETAAPEFRWCRGKPAAGGPIPHRVRDEIALRERNWPVVPPSG